MTLPAGTKLGPYEILAPLGAGGMGEVYRARDTRLGRDVAIKVLPAHLSSSAEIRQRFEREAKTISQLSHPHICAIYDVGNQDGIEYLVMEYLQGETLEDRLGRGALSWDQAQELGGEIAEGIADAHRHGVVHRDLKPGNIMLTRSGVKLLDFGLAKTLEPEVPSNSLTSAPTSAKDITEEGGILGTLSYMAPEQLEGKKADARTDIFAFGAVLYEMFTGSKAFAGASRASVISAILRDDPKPISQIQPMSPPALDRLIQTCLAKDPDKRWQSAQDVGMQLSSISGGPAVRPAPTAARSLSSSPRWLVGLAAAGLLAAAFAVLSPLRRTSVRPETPIRFAIHPPPGTQFVWSRVQNLFAVSPDGTKLVFAARGSDGRDSLWIRSLAEANAVALAGTEGAAAPFWSPDGRFVAFFAEDKLKKIDASGGPPVTLCDAPTGFPSGCWGSRHSILFADGAGTAFYLVEDGGGTPRVVLKPDTSKQEATISWPSFFPDGRHFIYVGRSVAEKQTYAGVASVDGGAAPLVKNCSRAEYVPPRDPGGSGYLLYARDGSLMAQPFDDRRMRLAGDPVPTGQEIWQNVLIGTGPFSASPEGVLASRGNPGSARLAWLDRAGGDVGSLDSPAGFGSVELSRDSKSVLVSKVNPRTGTSEIWIGDLSRSVLTKLDFGNVECMLPVWSPDATRFVLSIGSLGHPPLLSVASVRGGSAEAVLAPGPVQFAETWSPDGRFLVYTVRSGTQAGLWVANAQEPRNPRVLLTGVFDPVPPPHAVVSPDGHWIAFSSSDSGRSEIYLAAFPEPGQRIRVSTSGGSRPRWRQDGRELYYVSGDNELTSVPIQLASEAHVGAPQRLFRIDPAGWRDYDVADDGRRFLFILNVPVPDADAITVTVHWTSLIKR